MVALAGMELDTAGSYTADTVTLVRGAGVADRCLDAGKLRGCGRAQRYFCSKPNVCASAGRYSIVGPFPLLQYLPAWGFKQLGSSPKGAVRGLIVLSGIAALLLLVLAAASVGLRDERKGAIVAICLLTGPLLWYSHSGFGEALAAALLGALTLAVLRGWHPLALGVLAFAAALTKETSFPFIAAIAAIAWYSVGRTPRRSELAALGGGLVAGVAASVAFNVFRFDSPFNLFYGGSVLHTPYGQRPQYFAGLLVAPNGGLLWFWPSAAIVLGLGLAAAVRRHGWSRRLLRAPAVLALILLAALLAGLASWFSPYGAEAWGPRLLIPWIGPLVLIVVAAHGDDLVAMLSRRRLAAASACAVAAVAGLGSLGALFDSGRRPHAYPEGQVSKLELAYASWVTDDTCPSLPVVQLDRSYYYRCSRHNAWERSPIVPRAFADVWRHEAPAGILYLIAIAGIAGLFVRVSRAA